jgi:hypothetical protein
VQKVNVLFPLVCTAYASTIDGLFYTVVNMNGNNGKGVVTTKNQILMGGGLTFELEAMKHANGEDWWIVATEMFQNGFYRFLLTKDSITGPFYQQIGASMHGNYFSQATFSPDGAKFARFDTYNDLDVFDFDRCTGLLSNNQHITIIDTIDTYAGGGFSGIVFSPSSQYLYVNSGGYSVYQFDILANSIAASIDTVAIYDGYYQLTPSNGSTFFLGQLAPNGKIYFNSWSNLDVLHVIHSPDSAGAACNFEQHGFQLPSAGLTLPNFPHFRTPALSVPCDTVTSTTAIEAATEEDWVTIYPNPANNYLVIEWDLKAAKSGVLIIYNTLGQVVQQTTLNPRKGQQEVSLPNLPSGMYICKLFFDNKSVHEEKIIIEQP